MNQLHSHRVGLAFGTFIGGLHLLWSLLVAFSWAQPLLDFIFMLHMIVPVYKVDAFSFTRAFSLVVFTAMVGYLAGYAFSLVWNKLHQ